MQFNINQNLFAFHHCYNRAELNKNGFIQRPAAIVQEKIVLVGFCLSDYLVSCIQRVVLRQIPCRFGRVVSLTSSPYCDSIH